MTQRDIADVTQGRVAQPIPSAALSLPLSAWFALRLRSKTEFRVREQLADAGIENFLPTYTEETRWTDRSKSITRPLFSGYIFIRTAPTALHLARRVSGVVQVLGYSAGDGAPISDREVESLRTAIASRAKVSPCAYVAGDKVRVSSGPMAGAEGIVSRTKGAARIVIAIELLRRAVSVELDARDVAAVASAA